MHLKRFFNEERRKEKYNSQLIYTKKWSKLNLGTDQKFYIIIYLFKKTYTFLYLYIGTQSLTHLYANCQFGP